MALSSTDSREQCFLTSMQVYEVNENIVVVVGGYTDDVAIFALQGRAGEDNALRTGVETFNRFVAEFGEPVPTVGIVEGYALGHFINV